MSEPYDWSKWDRSVAKASMESDGLPDTLIVPLVEALRQRGVVTYQSCQGHDDRLGGVWLRYKDFSHARALRLAAEGLVLVSLVYDPENPVWCLQFRGEYREAAIEAIYKAVTGMEAYHE